MTASLDRTARLLGCETGKALGLPLLHQGPVFSAAFSLDGPRVVTASEDNTGRIWDVLLDCCHTQAEADRLASLGETLSGLAVRENGSLEPVIYDRCAKLAELARAANPRAPRLSVDWLFLDFARRLHLPGY